MKATETGTASSPNLEERYRARAFEASKDNARLKKEIERLEKKLAEGVDAIKEENAQLKQQLRTGNHRDTFRRLAKAAKVKDEGIDDLFALSGWKADKDEIDEAAMSKMLEELKAKKALFFDQGSGDTGDENPASSTKRVPAPDRGGTFDRGKSGIKLTSKELADPAFMLDPKNKEMILSAAKEGRINLPDREAI
jgi:cell division septum initiation protein DivIVA